VPAQTVDATPSDVNLFSKVVFMKQGRRFGLSAEQKGDVGRRGEQNEVSKVAVIRSVRFILVARGTQPD
jgi:hypothetical protein